MAAVSSLHSSQGRLGQNLALISISFQFAEILSRLLYSQPDALQGLTGGNAESERQFLDWLLNLLSTRSGVPHQMTCTEGTTLCLLLRIDAIYLPEECDPPTSKLQAVAFQRDACSPHEACKIGLMSPDAQTDARSARSRSSVHRGAEKAAPGNDLHLPPDL